MSDPRTAALDYNLAIKKKSLPPPSEQQAEALETFAREKCNLIINACAGSGKTTLILMLAQRHPEMEFLILMYNKFLARDTRARAEAIGVRNVTIGTIHHFGYKYYIPECRTDFGLKRVFQNNIPFIRELPKPDVIVVDEAQDLNPIMKMFLDRFFNDLVNSQTRFSPRMVILGDERQLLYEFKDADSRFLTAADKEVIFGYINRYPWKNAKLDASNRLTPPHAAFINGVMNRPTDKKIYSARQTLRSGESAYNLPLYVIGNPFKEPYLQIERLLALGYLPEDILVLAPSIRIARETPMKVLCSKLVAGKRPVFVSESDDAEFDDSAARGKICCCTPYQAKGIERKAVIVMNFDETYPRFYSPEAQERMSNALFVALTRASEELILIQNHSEKPLPFIEPSLLRTYCRVLGVQAQPSQKPSQNFKNAPTDLGQQPLTFAVTTLTRHCSTELIEKAISHLNLEPIIPAGYGPPRPAGNIKDIYGLPLSVVAITGTAASSLHEWHSRRSFSLIETVKDALNGDFYHRCRSAGGGRSVRQIISHKHMSKIQSVSKNFNCHGSISVADILYTATVHNACMSGYVHKLGTISSTSYNWVTAEHAREISRTIDEHIPRCSRVEYEYLAETRFPTVRVINDEELDEEHKGIVLQGVADLVIEDKRQVLEIKYGEVTPEHIIQVALYNAILGKNQNDGPPWEAYVLSVWSGHFVKVSPKTSHSFRSIIQLLVDAKVRKGYQQQRKSYRGAIIKDLTDEDFLEQNKNGFRDRIGKGVVPEWLHAPPTKSKYRLREERRAKYEK